jgi:hypothetical protein
MQLKRKIVWVKRVPLQNMSSCLLLHNDAHPHKERIGQTRFAQA